MSRSLETTAAAGNAQSCSAAPTCVSSNAAPRVLLVSLDGFRAEYVHQALASSAELRPLPALRWLAEHGSRAQAMTSAFPTVTFPNHWSEATGLYPEHHGIVANSFLLFDPAKPDAPGERFNMQNVDPKFWLGEPIWLSVQKAGLKAMTASWPGGEVPLVRGDGPLDTWDVQKSAVPFDGSQDATKRVDVVLDILRGDDAPSFLTLYFDDVDHAGHTWGPDSPQMEDAIAVVDAALWRLIEGLGGDLLLDDLNIIITSDHGMAPSAGPQWQLAGDLIYPPDIFNNFAALEAQGGFFTGTSVGIPCPGCDLDAARALAARINAQAASNTCYQNRGTTVPCASVFTAYAKQDLPASAKGYAGSDRVPAVIGLPAISWTVVKTTAAALETATPFIAGTHGWDPRWGAMEASLILVGPRVKKGVWLPSPNQVVAGSPEQVYRAGGAVPNTEVFGLIAEMLGLTGRVPVTNSTPGYAASVLLPMC